MHKYEQEGFAPVKELAKRLKIELDCICRTSDDLAGEVEQITATGNFDFWLVGSARSLLQATE